MHRIGLEYKDGSDLDYVASYDVPDEVPLQVIADLSRIYNDAFGSDEDGFEEDRVVRLNFEEWVLDCTGVVIVSVDEGVIYDAFTGVAW
jgi:hypothetical protein